ncbi:putative short-chain oxidoreductase [Peziza echinospora]|nr:putative short-chain oxidoreductase [Peziza echinospora]
MTNTDSTVVLITGTSTGIGFELVKLLLASGYKVIATSRSLKSASTKELEAAGAAVLQLDPSVPLEELRRFITEKALPVYGQIDVLINNAAYLVQGAMEEETPESIQNLFNVNVFSPFNLTTALLPHLRSRRTGLILHISSIAAQGGYPGVGYYCSSKAAMTSLTYTQKLELGPLGIEVAAVEPGYFRTSLLASANTRAPGTQLISDYDFISRNMFGDMSGTQRGDPKKGAKVIVESVVGKWRDSGRRVGSLGTTIIPLGVDAAPFIREFAEGMIKEADAWVKMNENTDCDDVIAAAGAKA